MAERQRTTFQVTFSSQEQKDAFHEKAEAVERLLFPDVSHQRDTFGFLNAVFDRVLGSSPLPTMGNAAPMTSAASFLDTSGIFTGDSNPDDQMLFVVEKKCLLNLCEGLVKQCTCKSSPRWKVESLVWLGHTARMMLQCQNCYASCTWASSRVLNGHYLANQKLIHAFTCAGMLPHQFVSFCKFADMGQTKAGYLHTML